MKNDNKIKSGKTKTRKKSGNGRLITAAIVVILLIGMAYALTASTKANQKTVKTVTSLKEIRTQIDSEYASRGTGTDTPAVVDNYTPILSPRKGDKLPDFAFTSALTLKAYEFAAEHPEILEQIPCYCGCGEHGSEASEGKPHKFVRDCFITDKGAYDNHASFCDICVAINVRAQSALPGAL